MIFIILLLVLYKKKGSIFYILIIFRSLFDILLKGDGYL